MLICFAASLILDLQQMEAADTRCIPVQGRAMLCDSCTRLVLISAERPAGH